MKMSLLERFLCLKIYVVQSTNKIDRETNKAVRVPEVDLFSLVFLGFFFFENHVCLFLFCVKV